MLDTKHLKKDYTKSNYFQSKFNSYYKLVETDKAYDLTDIFLKQLKSLFKISCSTEQICDLHNKLNEELKVYDQKFGVNKISEHFYDIPNDFNKKYIELLKFQIKNLIGQDFYFQSNPTVRIQVPHISSQTFYPMFHSDVQLGHPPYEINLWIPLNPPSEEEGYGFYVSSLEESAKIFKKYNYDILQINNNKKYISNYLKSISKTQNFSYGQTLLFDTRCIHSTIPLKNHTRVSVDVRIIPVDLFHKFNRHYEGTGRRTVIYKPGNAYYKNSIDEL